MSACGLSPIREPTTFPSHLLTLPDGRVFERQNSNGLLKNKTGTLGLAMTGHIREAGQWSES